MPRGRRCTLPGSGESGRSRQAFGSSGLPRGASRPFDDHRRANVKKRLVKSPKVYVRDSGLVHTLLRLDTLDDLLGHPVAGMSWEGFVIETLLRAAPERTQASFYRTATGVEMDLVLELPGNRLWAVEIKRGLAPKTEPGTRTALEDLKPDRAFLVYSGDERYPRGGGIETIGLRQLAQELAMLDAA
ncbi:DUF4143 domain-containing protein [Thiocapsa marina]|uniref:DUF4143 domain-containing protein n=1 Tax=Thiocapsa marina TaxID=244573 RepID=UPI0038995AC7